MEQFKRTQVIILPTQNKTYIGKHLENEVYLSLYTWYLKTLNIPNERQGQHLYIITDDEIKEGDWFIYNETLLQCKEVKLLGKSVLIITNSYNGYNVDNCRKIIATTDSSLNAYRREDDSLTYIPQPSQQFIEKYIESYNKGEVITDVLVEYINVIPQSNGLRSNGIIMDEIGLTDDANILDVPKLNYKDNTITVKKLKDSWNREEVVELLKLFENDIKKSINSDDFNNWIKENL